jgi:hypothetical protein
MSREGIARQAAHGLVPGGDLRHGAPDRKAIYYRQLQQGLAMQWQILRRLIHSPQAKSMHALAMLFSIAAGTSSLAAQERPDFNGRWELDTLSIATQGGGRGDTNGDATGGGGGRGGGLGLGPPANAVVIRQNVASLTIVEHDADDAQLVIILQVGGQERRNPLGVGRGEAVQAEYSTKWEGSRLVTIITRKLPTRRGQPQSMSYREVRSLADDGSMVVEVGIEGERARRTVVYRRAK